MGKAKGGGGPPRRAAPRRCARCGVARSARKRGPRALEAYPLSQILVLRNHGRRETPIRSRIFASVGQVAVLQIPLAMFWGLGH